MVKCKIKVAQMPFVYKCYVVFMLFRIRFEKRGKINITIEQLIICISRKQHKVKFEVLNKIVNFIDLIHLQQGIIMILDQGRGNYNHSDTSSDKL